MPRDYTAKQRFCKRKIKAQIIANILTTPYNSRVKLIGINMSPTVLSVSQLNNAARALLESEFMHVMVEGELSNFVCPASGHWYFSLKDDKAQVRCAMFRMANRHLRIQPENGAHVQVQAKVSLYAPRGDYQLIVEFLEEVGDGALRRAYEKLKMQLDKDGLFAESEKQALPKMPKAIGVVTSSTGAAIRDIINVLHRRCPLIPIIIYPTLVQGEQAAKNIAEMIQLANQRQECDVLIIGRGGGSLEDLWAFNEEVVARAIFASDIPIVSAVGHEIDVTIADFVADVRAPTPSAAAEIVSPNMSDYKATLVYYYQRLRREMLQCLQQKQQQLTWLRKRLRHPEQKLQEQAQQLDYLTQNLYKSVRHLIHKKQQQLTSVARALNTISPLATLDRGYAILQHDNTIIRQKKQVKTGDKLTAKVSDGVIHCEVI
jgi:exodeoxyribonuclease VII large subunit